MRTLKRIEFHSFGYEGQAVGIGCGVYVETLMHWSDGRKDKQRFYIGNSIDFGEPHGPLSVVPPAGGSDN